MQYFADFANLYETIKTSHSPTNADRIWKMVSTIHIGLLCNVLLC